MVNKAPGTDRLILLDGMRGLAAFAVIVDHVPSEPLRAMLGGRYLAVDFFFVLSGLVLARAYGASLSDAGGIVRFLKLRLIRFYPMYLLGLLLGIPGLAWLTLSGLYDFDLTAHAVSILTGLAFLPSPATLHRPFDMLFPYDGAAWSLFFELIANIVWAFLAFRMKGRLLALVIAVLAVWAGWTVYMAPEPGMGWRWQGIEIGLARVFFSFFMGVALHELLQRIRLPRIPLILPLIPFGFALAFPAGADLRSAFDVLAMLVIFPVTVLLAARTQLAGGLAAVCTWLGKVSYGVYILHGPLYALLKYKLIDFGLTGTQQVLVVTVLTALGTQLAITLYEAPLRRWLVARFVRRPSEARAGQGSA